MSALAECPSLEAEIADCCQALYRATSAETAMSRWSHLRELLARKAAEEDALFRREAVNDRVVDLRGDRRV
jgi:hypothetical protein